MSRSTPEGSVVGLVYAQAYVDFAGWNHVGRCRFLVADSAALLFPGWPGDHLARVAQPVRWYASVQFGRSHRTDRYGEISR